MTTDARHRHLARDPVMRRLIKRHGPCGIDARRWSPYEALTRAIAHQQLNGRAAQTILTRFVALFGSTRFPTPAQVLAIHPARVRGAGFSRGVGRWTVEMLLIFTLGRPDILPVDDFGVREGYRRAYGKRLQPKPKALRALGEQWKPYRSAAAWYLWRAASEPKTRT